jgi:hypothetical protein
MTMPNGVIIGWRGVYKREGALPPLKFSPPLKQIDILSLVLLLFERGIKGVSAGKSTIGKQNAT